MYTDRNFKTKKELKAAFKAGDKIRTYQIGPFGGTSNGSVCIEGPHYPEPHRWYATATIVDSVIVKLS